VWHDIRLLNGIANTLLGLVLLSVLASGVWWLAHRPMFTLRQIKIESTGSAVGVNSGTGAGNSVGNSNNTQEQTDKVSELRHVNALTIRSTALPRLRGNFFTTDLDAVRAAFEAVPWVRRASVRREWPNSLIVALEEHQVLANWGEDEGRLLSVNGELFTANLAEAEDEIAKDTSLPQLNGPAGSEKEVLARYFQLKQWFAPLNLTPEEVALSNRYAWSVKLNNGMNVELGRDQDGHTVKDRVQRLIAVHPKLMQMLNGKIDSVDMRYANGLALKSDSLSARMEAVKPGKPGKATKVAAKPNQRR
jgi:cell division protein FtsQ